MRNYAQVAPTFWIGETGKKLRKLGPEYQLTALYLLTCPASNMLGLYYLPLPSLCHEMGCSIEGARKALGSLSDLGFAHYDEESEVVWVVEMARYQIGARLEHSDKRVKGIRSEIERYGNTRLYRDFHARYAASFHLNPLSPLEGPSEPHRSTERERETEREKREGLAPQLSLEVQELGDADHACSPSALPGRKSASEKERQNVDKHRATSEKILDALNASRKRIKHTCRGITPSYSSLALIAERLDDGRSAEDCLHVIAVREAECRVNPGAIRYLDAVSPFRRENFERTSAADASAATVAPNRPLASGRPVEPRRPQGEDADEYRRRMLARVAGEDA